MLIVTVIAAIVLVPSAADAWGPLTHMYLGYQIVDFGAALLPAGIYGVIKRYKNDFLYGNLSADIIMGRRFQGADKNSHDWGIAWNLLETSDNKRQRAFAYGYLMHLCADTVVHNLDPAKLPFSHSMIEVKSDSIIDKKYRRMLKGLDKPMQKKNDIFLENRLESQFFSFKTNKRIFKSILVLSRFPNYTPVSAFIDNRFPYVISDDSIYSFQQESLTRMFELLANGRDSDVLNEHPLGRYLRKAS